MSSLSRYTRVGKLSWGVIGSGDDVLHSYGANQGLVLGKESSLVVDTGFHNQVAGRILRRTRTKGKRTLVLSSHYHSDHVFGNGVFAKAGASIIAHQDCGKKMRVKSEKLLDKYRKRNPRLSNLLRGVTISCPNIAYRDGITVQLGDDVNAEIIHPRIRAHTDGDSIVNIPNEHVVFAGDVFWVGYHPNLEDADIRGQVEALRMILKMKPRRIVPGHGPVSGPREVKRSIKYLEELDRNIRTGLRKNLREDELVRHAIPRWSWDWKMRWLMGSYIRDLAGKS
jgi:cyclase